VQEETVMAEHEKVPGYEGRVSCEYCRRDIPRSEAYQPEGVEYVAYFCGLACYEAWKKSGSAAED
jgi:hypothetical protein